MKKILLCVLAILFFVASLNAQEKNSASEQQSNKGTAFQVPIFGFTQNFFFTETWYDLNTGNTISTKDMKKILNTNPKSAKLLKKSRNDLLWGITLAILGSASTIAINQFDLETKWKIVGTGSGFMLIGMGALFADYSVEDYKQAVNIYNLETLGYDYP